MLIEVRMSDDGRVAALFHKSDPIFQESMKERADRPWCVLGWPDNSFITVESLADTEVEDWKVLYRKEG